MVAWIPAVKAILPLLAQIVTASIPAFTQKTGKPDAPEISRSEIIELQQAATQNAESLKALATQLQHILSSIDTGSAKLEAEIKAIKRLAVIAVSLSLISILFSLIAWLH